jgi:catechol 2,3-dioxygenase
VDANAAISGNRDARTFFRPRRLGHVNLVVGDVDRSMDFYMQIIGLEESYRRPLVKAGFLSNGNTHHDIGLVESGGPLGQGRRAGLNHTAFELETEVDLVGDYDRAISAGVEFDRTSDHDIAHSVYGRDADGNHYHSDPEIRRVADAIFHPRRTTHAVLVLENFERCFETYRTVVGLSPIIGDAHSAFAVLGGTCGERNLGLFRARDGRAPGLHHVGLQVWGEADLNESLKRLAGAGHEIEAAIDCPARLSVFIKDPDGIRLQLYVDRDPSVEALGQCDEETALTLV